jgi:eukaryotic-like serine/threonine-protein kinase
MPEVKIKISYPITWKIDTVGLPKGQSILLAIMFKKSEGSSPSVTILVNQIPPNVNNAPTNGKEYVEANITDLKNKHDDFILVESVPSILGGNIAHRATYVQGEAKTLGIGTIKGNKIYNITYRSKPEEYSQYLPIAEKMIESFEFLP